MGKVGSPGDCVCVHVLRVTAALMASATACFTRLGTTLRLYGCLKVSGNRTPQLLLYTATSRVKPKCLITTSSERPIVPRKSPQRSD